MIAENDRIGRFAYAQNGWSPSPSLINDLLILVTILIILVEIYRKLRQIWLCHLFSWKNKAKRPRKPAVLRPKSERDCRFCQENRRRRKTAERENPVAWALRKGKGGPKKTIATGGHFCPNKNCDYYRITDEQTHALVGYGRHGVHEEIPDFKCQACGKKFTARKNTILSPAIHRSR